MLKENDKRNLIERISNIEIACAEIKGIATVLACGASGARTAQTLIDGVARVTVGVDSVVTFVCYRIAHYDAGMRVYDTPVADVMTDLCNDIWAVIETACERENDVVDAICRGGDVCAIDSMEIKGLRHVMHIARGMMSDYCQNQ